MNPISLLFRIPHWRAQFSLIGDIQTSARLHFLYAAAHAGVLQALPATKDELVQRAGIRRPDLLEALLDLGVAVKELSQRDGRFSIRGRRARAFATPEGDAALAMVEEMLTYHADVYLRLAERLKGAELGSYLDEHAVLIARSSRTLDPLVKDLVRSVVGTGQALRMLEVGCGSGIYLRYAAEANPYVTGSAVDIQPAVVEQAKANLRSWGVGDRFEVYAGDIRQPPPEVAGPFDLITLYNNVYYFEEEERPALFEKFRSWLRPGGAFALVSLFRGGTVMARDFDLALRCTKGCTALPVLDDVRAQLTGAGFTSITTRRLMPVEPFYGLVARVGG